jgi:putative Holliday junction resolvase
MGIDYGSKRVGLALSDEGATLAFPLTTLKNTAGLIEEVCALCETHKIDTVVIGESKDFKGNENKIMEGVRDFSEKLKSKGLEVVLEPEIMSTIQAERLQGRADEQKETIDASAAAVILQSFLDRNMGGHGAEMADSEI